MRDSVAMMQVATQHTSVQSKKLHQRIPAQPPALPASDLSQIEVSGPPYYEKDSVSGYCIPWKASGDLCRPSTTGNHDEACAGVDSTLYYLPNDCDMTCARERCQRDSACVGLTYRNSDKRVKLKSIIEGVKSSSGYSCYRKPLQRNYLPIDFSKGSSDSEMCPGSDGEVEVRYEIGEEFAAAFGTCAKKCNTLSDCPTPPDGTTAVCDHFYKKCFVQCSKDSDCQHGATCTYNEICSYQLSTAMRTPSPEVHYGYPVYDRITVESPDDCCFGTGRPSWFHTMGAIFVVCAPPCAQDSDCPTQLPFGTRTTPKCIKTALSQRCYIPCSDNRDCQNGAFCLDYNPRMCAFPA